MKLTALLLATISACLWVVVPAQVQYVPAQVLVPIYNATGLNVANHTWYNQSRPGYGWNIPNYGGGHNGLNNTNGWNIPNYGGAHNGPNNTNNGWNIPSYGGNHNGPNNGNNGWNIPSYGGGHNGPNNTNYGWKPPSYGSYNPYRPFYRNSSGANTTNTTKEGNLMIGTIGLYDRLLFTKEYNKPGRWWSSREKIIEYPKDVASGYLRHETIAAIRVYNLLYTRNKARVDILGGGVGRQYVKIRLSSNWREGFKFLVQIYGK